MYLYFYIILSSEAIQTHYMYVYKTIKTHKCALTKKCKVTLLTEFYVYSVLWFQIKQCFTKMVLF